MLCAFNILTQFRYVWHLVLQDLDYGTAHFTVKIHDIFNPEVRLVSNGKQVELNGQVIKDVMCLFMEITQRVMCDTHYTSMSITVVLQGCCRHVTGGVTGVTQQCYREVTGALIHFSIFFHLYFSFRLIFTECSCYFQNTF